MQVWLVGGDARIVSIRRCDDRGSGGKAMKTGTSVLDRRTRWYREIGDILELNWAACLS